MSESLNTVDAAPPGSPAYAAATEVFNLAAPVEPAAAVTATSVPEVRQAVAAAESANLPVRVHSTGHAAATARPMRDSLLIRTRIGGGVEIDAGNRVARIPAGTSWGEVAEAAEPYGLAAPHGSSPLVGAVGYLLRGGISFYGRQTGIAANSVRAVELVTAGGRVRRADADRDPDLFWALRGGGGGFGVVTAVEVQLFPATEVVTGAAYWSATDAERLLTTWLDWTRTAPWAATTTVRLMNLPDHPDVPPALRVGTVLCVDGAVLGGAGGERIAAGLLDPLRAVAPPLLDTWASAAPAAVLQTHMDPTEPFPVYGDHMLLRDLDEQAVSALLRVAGHGSGSPLTNVEIRQLGGALAVPSPFGGALDHLDARFAYLGGGVPLGVTAEAIRARTAVLRDTLRPWDTGTTTPTFAANVAQPQRHLDANRIEAVDRVRARVDPAGIFRDDIAPNATALH
ncbi:oxidoreductase [Actinoplanes italicus]|uniref:FAD binding domain-containing protein n=1 Tax=Actinoplanes italicus TaxID=113567 RepID=A0A2T0K8L9_9ACTN|nr:FAD-dependent oxidoreductase [Actinoplanes italicus]PRX19407.1 FAD binding domain-containing protein [Actinoplanes italicus]GIE30578.1 oxidoreductase [Actinoplanes italicus]